MAALAARRKEKKTAKRRLIFKAVSEYNMSCLRLTVWQYFTANTG